MPHPGESRNMMKPLTLPVVMIGVENSRWFSPLAWVRMSLRSRLGTTGAGRANTLEFGLPRELDRLERI
jgi:hypothetical protein